MTSIDISQLPSLPLSEGDNLPSCTAIYFVSLDSGELLYVGKAVNLYTRWRSHHRCKQLESLQNVYISWIEVESSVNLDDLEANFIASFQPRLNGTVIPTEPKPAKQCEYEYITGRYGDWFVECANEIGMTAEDFDIAVNG